MNSTSPNFNSTVSRVTHKCLFFCSKRAKIDGMEDLKDVIAKNLVELRTKARLTQLELAEKINYTDKAVSKWERGEALPDLRVLIKLADIYNITIDEIVREPSEGRHVIPRMNIRTKQILISVLSAGLAWFVATVLFMIFYFIPATDAYAYLSFVCAPFACSIPLVVFSAKWGNWITHIFACSLLVWSLAIIFHIFVITFSSFNKIFVIYIVAGVFELLVIFWFLLRKFYKRRDPVK